MNQKQMKALHTLLLITTLVTVTLSQEECPYWCARCTPGTDQCEKCKGPNYGVKCTKQCFDWPDCPNKCTKDTGACCPEYCEECVDGGSRCLECQGRYYGPTCAERCLDECYAGCEQETGNCYTCWRGKWGEKCDKDCPLGCAKCTKDTGICQECRSLSWGPDCRNNCGYCEAVNCNNQTGCSKCWNGYWGKNKVRVPDTGGRWDCGRSCGEHCTSCDIDTGCTSCKTGYWGDSCAYSCTYSGCQNNNTDGSCYKKCAGGCDFESGECLSCRAGEYGADCEHECGDGCYECDRYEGTCLMCDTGMTAKQGSITCYAPAGCQMECWIPILIIIIIIIIVMSVIIIKRKNRWRDSPPASQTGGQPVATPMIPGQYNPPQGITIHEPPK